MHFLLLLCETAVPTLYPSRIPYDHAWKPLRAKPKKWLRRIPFFVSFFLSERAAGEENFLPLEPEAECFAPPNVLPPPKNSGRVGGAKHPDVTGTLSDCI